MKSFRLLGGRLLCGDMAQAVEHFLDAPPGAYVTLANVHTLTASRLDRGLAAAQAGAHACLPDGKPLMLAARAKGWYASRQVRGLDFMLAVARAGLDRGLLHYFYGGGRGVAREAASRLAALVPGLKVAGWETPAFSPQGPSGEGLAGRLAGLKVDILWVGLGAPKQEKWMAAMAGRLPCRMAGVGAAFDFLAGRQPEAPPAWRAAGLEWFYRLVSEPRRLWRRYAATNPAFLLLAGLEYFGLLDPGWFPAWLLKLLGLLVASTALLKPAPWVVRLLGGAALAHAGHCLDRWKEARKI